MWGRLPHRRPTPTPRRRVDRRSTRVLNHRTVFSEYLDRLTRHSENVRAPEVELTPLAHYEVLGTGEDRSLPWFNVNRLGADPPLERRRKVMAGQAVNFDLLKHVRETDPA